MSEARRTSTRAGGREARQEHIRGAAYGGHVFLVREDVERPVGVAYHHHVPAVVDGDSESPLRRGGAKAGKPIAARIECAVTASCAAVKPSLPVKFPKH